MLVLFDLDDTLIDHSGAVSAGVAVLHEHIQPPLPLPEFLASWTAAMRQHFPLYLNGQVTYEDQRRARMRQTVSTDLSDAEADELFARYFDIYQAKWALYPDVLPCFAQLENHRLGLITNGNGAEQRSKLARTGITDRFEVVQVSGDCGFAKPAAQIFHRVCELAGVPPRDAVYVGDFYEVDAVGSRNAGLHGIWLDRNNSRSSNHAPPMISGLSELAPALRSLAE